MEAMSKICSPCGSEAEEKRVTSISPEDDFSIQDVRKVSQSIPSPLLSSFETSTVLNNFVLWTYGQESLN